MTHEHKPNAEHPDGPEHDDSLPNAEDIEVFDNPENTFLMPLPEDK